MDNKDTSTEFDTPPSDEDFERARFQIFHQTKTYELSQKLYPLCVSECVASNKTGKDVFMTSELECANNCLNKYRQSLQMLISYVTMNNGS